MRHFRKYIWYMMFMQIYYAVLTRFSLCYIQAYGYRVSAVDYLLSGASPYAYGIVLAPAMVFLVYDMNRTDWRIPAVLKYGSPVTIFKKQICRITALSVVTVACHTISILLWSVLYGYKIINWNQKFSLYYGYMEKTTEITAGSVIWKYVVGMEISLLVVLVTALAADWCGRRWAGYFTVFFVAALEMRGGKLFYKRVVPGYWNIENTGEVLKGYVVGIFLFLLLFLVNVCIMKRKEYLNEK